MPVTEFQYFSVAVNDLEAGIERYTRLLGLTQMSEITEQRWGFRGCMLGNGTTRFIELISPSRDDSALARFMKMRNGDAYPGGEGLYLVGLRVDDIKATVATLQAAGAKVTIEDESPSLAWLHPLSNGNVLIELNDQPMPGQPTPSPEA